MYFQISLTVYKIHWQFPDLEKISISLTFPWRVATLNVLEMHKQILGPYRDSSVSSICSVSDFWALGLYMLEILEWGAL